MNLTRDPILVLAAGSLQPAFREIAAAFAGPVDLVFGPSGTLRQRIEAGAAAHLFASADLAHPSGLVASGRGDRVRPFARNGLCVLVRAEVGDGQGDVLDLLLDPDVRLGMSTPGVDPSGDYVLKLFAAAERLRPGAGTILAAKARRLTGTANHAEAPGGLNQYAWLLALGRADLFVTYRTSALAALRDNPALRLIELPAALAVEARYAMTVLDPAALPLAGFVAGATGAAILERHGFLSLEHR